MERSVANRRAADVRVTAIGRDLLVVSVPADAPAGEAAAPLTASEREVLRQAARGLSNSAIARLRGRSERTIANQLASAYAKLGIEGRRGLRAVPIRR